MSSSISIVLIPTDPTKPLQTHPILWSTKFDINSSQFGKKVHRRMISLLHEYDGDDDECDPEDAIGDLAAIDDRVEVPLLRPHGKSHGLYAYFRSGPNVKRTAPNIRATRLAMACGLMTIRLSGTVALARLNHSERPRWANITADDVQQACEISPDLRTCIQREMSEAQDSVPAATPAWIKNAAQQNYHDAAAVARMVSTMKAKATTASNQAEDTITDDESSIATSSEMAPPVQFTVTAKGPICLHCRRPTNNLCNGCDGAYFCPTPTHCDILAWSHTCQCRTWKTYISHREELSTFQYLDPEWQAALTGREFQVSEEPYKNFLSSRLMIRACSVSGDGNESGPSLSSESTTPSFSSWWLTETNGWAGGESASAKQVDITIRRSFEEGFAPVPVDQLPPPRRVSDADYERAGIANRMDAKNDVGLWNLCSWEDYYRLRDIPPQSPVALLCTFPLTIYRAIVEYGDVPVTVARMLNRPLRIHVVGTEKELNFLDLFQELGYLLPEDLKVELIFVAREDMLPTKCKHAHSGKTGLLLDVAMTSNLRVGVVGGTYGSRSDDDELSNAATEISAPSNGPAILDPNFDCGSGPPDMLIAMNAGLYAYESWRSVVEYLYLNQGVVGVFTDYNEYSGVNCAGLGGAKNRESLCINPFRQPLAMPVYSMNLPQFSNGFFYVYNAQELE